MENELIMEIMRKEIEENNKMEYDEYDDPDLRKRPSSKPKK